MCSQGADPLSDLLPFLPATQKNLGLNLDISSRHLDDVEDVILGEDLCVEEVRAGRVSYFSFPHRTQPTHDFSWRLTIRNRRFLGPSKSIQASAVDGEHPLADIKVLAPVIHTPCRLHQGPAYSGSLRRRHPVRFAPSQGVRCCNEAWLGKPICLDKTFSGGVKLLCSLIYEACHIIVLSLVT
jgi:hypothetical protein